MARRYKVEGTSDFLITAVVLAALGLWCVKDGWFPSPTVLERHPREMPVAAGRPAIVTEIPVTVGQEISTNTVIARVRPLADSAAAAKPAGAAAQAADEELRCRLPGTVQEIPVKRMDQVTAIQAIVVVAPEDHFYAFNKSLAVITLLGAIACAGIHLAVR